MEKIYIVIDGEQVEVLCTSFAPKKEEESNCPNGCNGASRRICPRCLWWSGDRDFD